MFVFFVIYFIIKNQVEIQEKLKKYLEANNGATKKVIQTLENLN